MADANSFTIVGTLTADPELHDTSSGASVAGFTIARNDRRYDKQTGKWVDGDALYLRCSCWRELAEHVSQSLGKGQRVIATGSLKQRSYQAQDGSKRTVIEMQVEAIGPDLRFTTAQVFRVPKGTGRGFVGRDASREANNVDDPGAAPIPAVEQDPFSQSAAEAEFGGSDEPEW
ncbi:MAG: single-stranded DNA-binding protein [Bifidobacterium tibiigranuli]|jgi:single-strand DNA-binding protein|uniref:single-stranded DNA-binding protein n=1 Tax=Bifidobacterium tibiigranuli TaxID=2172043 RepID=UPI0026EEF114|nr:single-stranded DNA-binding protein [Bifidobacterium tibiigranuli]MCI1673173.1 single-stranded DNA-binding protein [Bifidobacterium tibiigranuli]MCI1713582.1 single-stranded DNA-binding protein [Bifidobacterium tibiigranuli]